MQNVTAFPLGRAAALLMCAWSTSARAQMRSAASVVEHVLPAATTSRPGCAVGVDHAGEPRVTLAYGAADLEFGVAATPETIYEAGSISKQFTASAIVLLALDGKVKLSDDVRKYVPELPVYERPITLDLLLHHTSGLRDWGDIAAIAGWPRGSRAHTNDHVLDILSRQHALNYPPGDKYSYTNSGFNLLAITVERVSGKSLAQFSKERLFTPLGLRSTSWRDDFTRLVRGRAQAYAPTDSGWALDMPFENAYGNGGLLTTVGDLLTWMQLLEHPRAEFKAMVDSLHVQGHLTDGTTISYARGLFIDDYRGVPRVQHSGSTAGYRTFAERFPGKGVAIAVLCNAANANPGAIMNQIADSLLAPVLAPVQRVVANGAVNRRAVVRDTINAWPVADYRGTYSSAEAETRFEVVVGDVGMELLQRPGRRIPLRPVARDSFTVAGSGMRVWFTRGAGGKVDALHVYSSRAYDVVFKRENR